jgi:hypothetical protein
MSTDVVEPSAAKFRTLRNNKESRTSLMESSPVKQILQTGRVSIWDVITQSTTYSQVAMEESLKRQLEHSKKQSHRQSLDLQFTHE